jgi:RNA polymerase sigma factor (sigma-70 family)
MRSADLLAALPEARQEDAAVDPREAALSHLVRACASRALRISTDLLRSRVDAEDAVQEALARACRDFDKLRDHGSLEGWFFRVLINVCMRTRRRQALWRTLTPWRGQAPAAAPEPIDPARRADESLVARAELDRLNAAIDELPGKQRTALLLRYGHDASVAEIADMLGIGVGTAKTHLARALARTRTRLERTP